jgi:hypothetical protein
MHGLFLTCLQRILSLCSTQLHEQLIFGHNPVCCKRKTHLLEESCLAHGGKILPIQFLCSKPTALTLTFQKPLTPPTSLTHTISQQRHQQFRFLDPEQLGRSNLCRGKFSHSKFSRSEGGCLKFGHTKLGHSKFSHSKFSRRISVRFRCMIKRVWGAVA